MRIEVRLPKVEPEVYREVGVCPKCGGTAFRRYGQKGERKVIRDLRYEEVESQRYQCERCGYRKRVYPVGVSRAQQSDRLKGMSVLLYLLGLSYGGVSDFLGAVGAYISKTTVYNNVQEAGEKARKKQRQEVRRGGKRAIVGADGTWVKVKGKKVGIEVIVDDKTGELLGLEIITSENGEEVLEVLREVVEEVGAEVVATDDHGAYKEVVEIELGKQHQVCRAHVERNVEEWSASIREQMKGEEASLATLGITPEQMREDLALLQRLAREHPPDGATQLKTMYHRYKGAPAPGKGKRHSVGYRMRMLVTRLWDNWKRLTLYLRRGDLDGTNNTTERLTGWWIKERYRTMRGYQREASIKNVVFLTARMGIRSGHYDMAELFA